jgi:tetratricopeptide (TPR) repeat protein
LKRALKLSAAALGPTHPLVAYPSALLGRLYSRQGRYAEAGNLLGHALQISRQAWGEHNGGTFHNVAALAENYARQGQIAEAESLLLEAVRRGEQTNGPRPEIAVETLPYPGFFYLWQRRYRDAEDSVVKSRSASLARYGEEHPITFLNTIVIGMVYRELGRHDEAEEQLRSAVDFAREYLTAESVMAAGALHELAILYQRQGRHAEAERLHSEVLDIQRCLLVKDHWHTLGTIRDLIALYAAWDRPLEARKWFNVLRTAYAEKAAASPDDPTMPGDIRYDRATDTYGLTAPASPRWAIEKEINFSLPEPSSEMWGVCDEMHFAYKTLHGDGSLTVKVESIDTNHYSIRAGVMIRSTPEPTCPHAAVVLTPLGDVVFRYRTVELGAARSTYAADRFQSPHWLRLSRRGDVFIAQHSRDGVKWEGMHGSNPTLSSRVEIPMGETVYLGLALTSQDPNRLAEAQISHITFSGTTAPDGPLTTSKDITLLPTSAPSDTGKRNRE